MADAATHPSAAAVVALKRVEHAKSRLRPLPDALRRRLAWTMAVDTLHALRQACAAVLVVSGEPRLQDRFVAEGLRVEVLGEPGEPGINAALRHGADRLRSDGHPVVLAAVADLPALHPDELAAVLAASGPYLRSYVADTSGVGTTVLVARGVELDPQFQGRSAAAHRASGAVHLTGSFPHVRRDVDTLVDLADAYRLGLGSATAALFDADGRLVVA